MPEIIMAPFTALGLVWALLFAIGWALNGMLSAWAHRTQRKRTERLINWLFLDDMHCAKAYLSEMNRTQSAEEYRR